MRYGEEARQYNHDQTQSHRRTTSQNETMVDVILKYPVSHDITWIISDVTPEGGPIEITNPITKSTWIIDRDGSKKLKETE